MRPEWMEKVRAQETTEELLKFIENGGTPREWEVKMRARYRKRQEFERLKRIASIKKLKK